MAVVVLVNFVSSNFVQPRVTWDERTPVEGLPSSHWAGDMSLGAFLDCQLTEEGLATVGCTPHTHKQAVLGSTEKLADVRPEMEPIKSLEFPPRFPSEMECGDIKSCLSYTHPHMSGIACGGQKGILGVISEVLPV